MSVPHAAQPPDRLLLGPGPSPVHSRVLEAQARAMVGHLDPWFLERTDEIATMLRRVLRTENALTFAVSGTGSAGMEAAVVNIVEPGDTVVVGINGVFGRRLADTAERCGAAVVALTQPMGRIVPPDQVDAALADHPGATAVMLVHAETSTGAWQPLEEVGALVADSDALLVVDAVTSLGGVPVEVDAWGLDVVYSGTQKCLSAPPGLAPITFSAKAEAVMQRRRTRVRSWYLDVTAIRDYWGSARTYHHTAPISSLFGLHEALRIVLEEDLDARWLRHREVGRRAQTALEERGWRLFAEEGHRLPQLTAVVAPDGVDADAARRILLERSGIEVGGGLGELAGRGWRVGLMGEGATHANLDRLLDALDDQG
ncbi:MAG TPA: alanine--glyoxylate aminotransferase family protein [Nitriliruptorales bacterium]|nr:alanine--glyoxylate aminotransferase family protein [Nitriliruptorales bacterium]